jgi:uncharacterized membrane protein YhaH (DUF805 family)
MDEARYRILFDGMVLIETPEETVKANLARLFECDLARIEPLFGGQTTVLKRNLARHEADHYVQTLRQAGAIARKEHEPIAKPVQTAPQIVLLQEPERVKPVVPTETKAAGPVKNPSTPFGAAPIPVQRPTYKSPAQELAERLRQQRDCGYCELEYISLKGRLGRARYLVWSMAAMLPLLPVVLVGIFIAMKSPALATLGSYVVMIILLAFNFTLAVRRLHDMNGSGWWALFLFMPIAQLFLALFLLLKSGDDGGNDYGPPPPPNGAALNIAVGGTLLILMIGFWALYSFYQSNMRRIVQQQRQENMERIEQLQREMERQNRSRKWHPWIPKAGSIPDV